MSDTQRQPDEGRPGGVGWDGVPEGTSGAAAPGTEAAPLSADRPDTPASGADDARARAADQAERARRDREQLDHPIGSGDTPDATDLPPGGTMGGGGSRPGGRPTDEPTSTG